MTNARAKESFEEYTAARLKKRQTMQRVFAVVSIASFVATVIPAMMHLMVDGPANRVNEPDAPSQQEVLQQQEQGYLLVLKREPNNQTALEGLINLRLQRQDYPGAIVLLERVVKMAPNRQDLQVLLQQLKQEVNKSAAPAKKP